MHAIITVFRQEFYGKEKVLTELSKCCAVIEEVAGAFIINPHAGKLFESIEILRSNKIAYGTHFNSIDH